MTAIENLVKARKRLNTQLAQFEESINTAKTKEWNLKTCQKAESQLDDWLVKLDDNLEAISVICAKDEETYHTHECEYVKLCKRRMEAMELLFKTPAFNEPQPQQQNNGGSSQLSAVKLPKIDIPKFSGGDNWLQFRDLFTTTIHNNSSLTGVQKLQYLTSCISGEPTALIKNVPVCNSGYTTAWKNLEARYHHEIQLKYSQLSRLFELPTVNSKSASSLRNLVDTAQSCRDSLEILQVNVVNLDLVFVFAVIRSLDSETKLAWDMAAASPDERTFTDLADFINKRADSLALHCETEKHQQPKTGTSKTEKTGGKPRQKYSSNHTTAKAKCGYCQQTGHYPSKCEKFRLLSVKERKEAVKKNKLCFVCLGTGHGSSECTYDWKCRMCNERHHFLIHPETTSSSSTPAVPSSTVASGHSSGGASKGKLLATAMVQVKTAGGDWRVFRALLDTGSEASIITTKCLQLLGLKTETANIEIAVVGGGSGGTSDKTVNLTVRSCLSNFTFSTEAFVLPKLTRRLPKHTIQNTKWDHLENLQLADPTFYKSANIDLLLGVDVCAAIKQEGFKSGLEGTPVAENSKLGWLLFGQLPTVINNQLTVIQSNHADVQLNSTLERFWQLEEIPTTAIALTADEQFCEDHFQKTHQRVNNEYIVRLPFRETSSSLGASRDIAVRRLHQVERRLARDPQLQQQYTDFLEEYLQLGHMELIEESQLPPSSSHCYISHHEVLKESSTTTKCRVVFNASSNTSNGVSLNSLLHIGRVVQDTLISTVLRFRTHPVALTADVEKMYRQIKIHTDDCDFQRIVWRRRPEDTVQDYRLLTVTYGTGPAPYLATRVLQQIGLDKQQSYPTASTVVQNDFYVDDVMSGEQTSELALQLANDRNQLLQCGGFNLRKWYSNDPTVFNVLNGRIPGEDDAVLGEQRSLPINSDSHVKALGIRWHPETDCFTFQVAMFVSQVQATKRTLLSDIARLFDPLGWLAPTLIQAKLLLQDLWRLKLDWDDTPPSVLLDGWDRYRQEMLSIEAVKIPRCICPYGSSQFQLHGFSDASEKAYAAAVYLRSINLDGSVNVFLVTAKTQVAPLKTVSIPRLELCGAELLSKLMDVAGRALQLNFESIHAWTDSTIVLGWLSPAPTAKQEVFVANRVTKITNLLPSSQWHHVSSEENPADCSSRGISPSQLENHSLWWRGPSWLSSKSYSIPETPGRNYCPAESHIEVQSTHSYKKDPILRKCSSLKQLISITGWILRWRLNHRDHTQHTGPLTVLERRNALIPWLKQAQQQQFKKEIENLKAGKLIPSNSQTRNLAPFLDTSGLLRVGGRLRHSNLTYHRKFPILLPQTHIITKLLIEESHLPLLHGGTQLVLSSLNLKYWIVNGRQVIQQQIRRCFRCVQLKATLGQQMMADLPSSRVNSARAFSNCGVDYAGPFTLKQMVGKYCKNFKGWAALFICFVTRSIHIELVSDLSTPAFLAAFHRFISRRGRPSTVHSDNGTNFVGAAKELRDLQQLLNSREHNDQVTQRLAVDGISWKFNPPSAPHFGGLWEAGVKSMKGHLKRYVGEAVLTFEEMTTVLSRIEACLNSRPLSPISADPTEFSVLTPGHFLIGAPLTAMPEEDQTYIKLGRLKRWQRLGHIVRSFWKRWSHEYLVRLQQRPKWASIRENLQVNDLVLIMDDNLPPLQWKRVRVVELHPAADNLVRKVTLRIQASSDSFSTKLIQRPIVKLCLLPRPSVNCETSPKSASNSDQQATEEAVEELQNDVL